MRFAFPPYNNLNLTASLFPRIFFPGRLLPPFPSAVLQTVKNNDSRLRRLLQHSAATILK
jgi:hypothetical protein